MGNSTIINSSIDSLESHWKNIWLIQIFNRYGKYQPNWRSNPVTTMSWLDAGLWKWRLNRISSVREASDFCQEAQLKKRTRTGIFWEGRISNLRVISYSSKEGGRWHNFHERAGLMGHKTLYHLSVSEEMQKCLSNQVLMRSLSRERPSDALTDFWLCYLRRQEDIEFKTGDLQPFFIKPVKLVRFWAWAEKRNTLMRAKNFTSFPSLTAKTLKVYLPAPNWYLCITLFGDQNDLINGRPTNCYLNAYAISKRSWMGVSLLILL